MYKVTLIMDDQEVVIDCQSEDYILDACDDAGLDLPYSCRAGACSTCLGKLKAGKVNQDDQSYLSEEDIDNGWVLTCIAIPESDCTILTAQEDNY